MFVKKLVEIAAKKPGGSSTEGLRANDVEPRVALHYGIPSGSHLFAYDPFQKILAVSTKDGRIKLFGKDQTQALLVSEETSTSRFLEFVQNQGILLNVNAKNQIEVWDLDKKLLSHVHLFNGEITSFRVMQHTPYFYVGDSSGNVSVFKIEQESNQVIQMEYTIPYLASNGSPVESSEDTSVVSILPQPTAESKRILLVFSSGFIALWDIKESKPILKTGVHGMVKQDAKKATCACWVCPSGSRVSVGYSNGDILVWSILSKGESSPESSAMICKLNLGYKSEKIPIASLKWVYAEGKASRVYVIGSSSNSLQVVLLNEQTETRMIKLGLHVSEPCADMEMIIADVSEQSKHKQDYLFVLGKSGRVYAYDDYMIEKYLIQSQSKSSPSLPKETVVKLPFSDSSSITVGKLLTNPSHLLNLSDEDYAQLAKDAAPFLPFQAVPKEGSRSAHFPGFTKVKNVYITGHSDGTIGVWDMTCPFLIPLLFLKEQTDQDISSRGNAALTALHYDSNSRLLVSGDHNGMVRLYRFKPEPYLTENSFIPFQGSSKKGNSHIVQSVKSVKLTGSITCIQKSQNSKHLAIGSDQGHVSLVDIEEANVLYTKHIASDICPGIISLQFESCSVQGFEKNVLVVAMRDSSVFALDSDTGNMIGTNMIKPKKPFKVLYMQILDGKQDTSGNGFDTSRESTVEEISIRQPSVLVCSEKAIYIYSLAHVVQGVKKVLHKKKFSSSPICSASTFYGTSGVGLTLVFTDGTVEIRSLPELSLLKQTSIRGFTYSSPKPNSLPETTISASWDGDLVMVNGDDELIVSSVLPQKDSFRLAESMSRVYKKDKAVCHEGIITSSSPREKKSMFGSVFKTKSKRATDTEPESSKETVEELSKIFATANFPWNNNVESSREINTITRVEDEEELDIDDIDIDDHQYSQQQEKPKEQGLLSGLSKQKMANRFSNFKGKLKQMAAKNEKSVVTNDEKHEEKNGATVDQIKKKYGFTSSEEMGAAKMAQSKLQDNLKKLQGISLRTTEMEDTAKSFSSTAKELLSAVEFNKQSSKP
ncbi:Lethal giant larvae (Lgl)-like C-terminal domain [Arabidopsis suecica]|uniref:Lethal giant larvae (Lgl)-like C-terminal domain n=1 Tax=Arabidopsis suecica TaxID=45249 RepID=A0A8T1YFZ2_ARASU|nr:Lethal giant larvae (Lgl)-like C-terminal domain [Arabidopsis suecica]